MTTSTTSTAETAPPDLDALTRSSINSMRGCLRDGSRFARDLEANAGQFTYLSVEILLTDSALRARGACRRARVRVQALPLMDLGKGRAITLRGLALVDEGLTSFLDYIDTKRPTKLVLAFRKLEEGARLSGTGMRLIDVKRGALGLPRLLPQR